MVLAIRRERNNPSLAQGAAVRFAIVPFVQPQAFGVPFAFADANAINRLQQLDEIISVGGTEGEVEGMAMASMTRWRFSPLIRCFPE